MQIQMASPKIQLNLLETFFFQFLNPKGIIVAIIIIVSTYVDLVDQRLYKLFFMGNWRCIFFCMCKYYFLDIAWENF